MLIGDYKLNETVAANKNKVTLTTASSADTLFPKQDAGTTSTIRRVFAYGSMFDVSGDLTLETVILDGMKSSYTVATDGGIANVKNDGSLTIHNGATLQNSKTDDDYNGGAVHVASGGTVTMTGGTVNQNESVGDGAGIYLAQGGTLNLSGAPSFGGTGLDVSGNIITPVTSPRANGNFKTGELVAQLNGGKNYGQARQDIYVAGYANESDDDISAASLVVDGDITSGNGTIWVWAEQPPRYKTLGQFARYTTGVTDTGTTLAAFRNAQDDVTTGADQIGEYLYGMTRGDGPVVYWSGVTGSRKVILRKVGEDNVPLSGVTFRIFNSSWGELNKGENGEGVEYTSDNSGVYFVGDLPYGTYRLVETVFPDGYNPDGYTSWNREDLSTYYYPAGIVRTSVRTITTISWSTM